MIRRVLKGLPGPWCEKGGVMMEYVLVTAIIVAFLIGASGFVFSPGKPVFTMDGAIEGTDFGILGNAFALMFRMIMKGISLPLP